MTVLIGSRLGREFTPKTVNPGKSGTGIPIDNIYGLFKCVYKSWWISRSGITKPFRRDDNGAFDDGTRNFCTLFPLEGIFRKKWIFQRKIRKTCFQGFQIITFFWNIIPGTCRVWNLKEELYHSIILNLIRGTYVFRNCSWLSRIFVVVEPWILYC